MARRLRREDERVGTAASLMAKSLARRFTNGDDEHVEDTSLRHATFESGKADTFGALLEK
jgi:hypothetical protein